MVIFKPTVDQKFPKLIPTILSFKFVCQFLANGENPYQIAQFVLAFWSVTSFWNLDIYFNNHGYTTFMYLTTKRIQEKPYTICSSLKDQSRALHSPFFVILQYKSTKWKTYVFRRFYSTSIYRTRKTLIGNSFSEPLLKVGYHLNIAPGKCLFLFQLK